jgi:deazaflavin-dependent oxidoreductase (nitroreductase family)
VPGIAILETTGRNSGRPRRTPVGRSLDGDTRWIVAEHGRKASYVRNIEADPRVRIKIGRRWRTGTAHLMLDDDPRARQRAMPADESERHDAVAVGKQRRHLRRRDPRPIDLRQVFVGRPTGDGATSSDLDRNRVIPQLREELTNRRHADTLHAVDVVVEQ